MGNTASRFGPKVVVQRRRVWWPFACALVVAACGLGVLAVGLHGLRHGVMASAGVLLLPGLAALLFGKLAAAVLWIVKPTSRREVCVEAEAGQLVVAGLAMPASGAVASAVRGGSWRVDVYDGARQPAAVFVVSSTDDAAALAAAATPAVADRPVSFYLPFYQSNIGTSVAAICLVASLVGLRLVGKSAWSWPALSISLVGAALMLVAGCPRGAPDPGLPPLGAHG